MLDVDIYKLKDRLKSYQKGREEYLKLIEIAKDNLKEYDDNARNILLEDINLRKKEELELFCKSAKYLYKNRDEIIKSGYGCLIIDFLRFNYSNKIYLKDLLNAWEEGFTILKDDEECFIIGLQDYTVTDFEIDDSEITYLKNGEIKKMRLSRTKTDNLLYSIHVDVMSVDLDNKFSDFKPYQTLSEIPGRFLGIEDW